MGFDLSAGVWQSSSLLGLAVLMLVAIAFDFKQRRVPNHLVLLALLAGILIQAIGPVASSAGTGGLFSTEPSALGVKGAVLGALSGLAVFLPFYLLRIMGAGDVKLMAAVGAWAGVVGVVNLTLFILAMGGVLSVVTMVWTRTTAQVIFNVSTVLCQLLPSAGARFDPSQSAYRMPYTVAIAGGMAAYGFWLQAFGRPLIQF